MGFSVWAFGQGMTKNWVVGNFEHKKDEMIWANFSLVGYKKTENKP